MRLLMMHTAGGEGSVALADTEASPQTVAAEMLPGRSSSERLVSAVKRLMEAEGWRLVELAAVVVVHGPGSFTGVRVGVSAAKGLSEASGVRIVAISRLELLARCVEGSGRVHAVLDGGRGEFYYGEYDGVRCVRETLMTQKELEAVAGGGLVVVCEAKVVEALRGMALRVVEEPSAADALPIAVERVSAGRFEDAGLLDAHYLRRTDAEIFAKPAGLKAAVSEIARPGDAD
ncbi:MAG: tRNA (adenosine(37)-N6)-threonylcarbamoyltransferase complex dimerization subunit type 1 TsaB [Acidobacteriota bacterium]|nr:tRNA (adenosine(37)-N6)-threonylcarbamoyltransferase complex dimerization subunit type 1 TsaB [Acidobacteriota bacterium]